MGRWARNAHPHGHSELDTHPDAVDSENVTESSKLTSQAASCRYIWKGVEKTLAIIRDGDSAANGPQPLAPASPMKEYEDKLKAIDLCANGVSKSDISRLLGRSEHWVRRWWKQQPQLIPKPNVKHAPLVQNAPLMSFRDLELRRNFVPKTVDLMKRLLADLVWEPARRATRNAETGELRVRFDSAGRSMEQKGRFVAEYRAGIDYLDRILQQIVHTVGVRDPGSRVFFNRYESGAATCPVHRHDFWTAMVSFGAERVAIVEESPMLLHDGDLLIFGTQSHGCPEMPDVVGRRISIVIFFRPDADNLERRWSSVNILLDEDEPDDADKHQFHYINANLSKGTSTAHGQLVDNNLCGCPGISLGLVARRKMQVQTPVTVFTVGCSFFKESCLFKRLRDFRIDEVWDIRHSFSNCSNQWHPEALQRVCVAHTIKYRRAPLGRPEAGGIAGHVASEEGLDIMSRILVAAEKGHNVTLLGEAVHWQECDRRVVADSLASGDWGPVSVAHIDVDGEGAELHGSIPNLHSDGPASVHWSLAMKERDPVILADVQRVGEKAANRFTKRCVQLSTADV